MNRRTFLFTCAAAAAGQELALPPPSHPRLFFQRTDIERLRARLTDPRLARAVTRLRTAASAVTANASMARIAEIARSRALLAVLGDDAVRGRSAVALMTERLPDAKWDLSIGDISREIGLVMLSAGMVYDWCYPWLQDDGPKLIEQVYRLARMLEVGYPPTGQGAITGHAGEAMLMRDLLGTGLAIYDESPEMYRLTAGRISAEFVPARNFFYPSHVHHQGSAYGPYRYRWEVQAALILQRAGLGNPFVPDQSQIPYRWVYTERPDGKLLPEGDVFRGNPVTPAYMLSASLYSDPNLQNRFLAQKDSGDQDPVEAIVLWDPDVESRAAADLPLGRYFGPPYSGLVLRTAWNGESDDPAIVECRVKEWQFNNHQHLDAGAFQIWYRGPLALDSGLYRIYNTPHDGNYVKRTVAHNTILVGDGTGVQEIPSRWVPDGGQRWPNDGREPRTLGELQSRGYRTGRTLGHELQADWAYLEGDLSEAYSPQHVERHQRAFVWLRKPRKGVECTLVVFDRVRAGAGKRWLLHTASAPEVSDSGSSSGNGRARLVHEAVLPADRRIDVIGGPGAEFSTGGRNYEPDVKPQPADEAGEWRLEVLATSEGRDEQFLNVLTVTAHDVPAPSAARVLSNATHRAVLVGDHLVAFSASGERIAEEVRLDLPTASQCIVTGLAEGTWTVTHADGQESVTVGGTSGVAVVQAPAGALVLQNGS